MTAPAVLVVDDSAQTLAMMNETLEAEGYTVLISLDGQQAITIAERLPPSIILLDAMMPNMDGFETCRRLKAHAQLADIPVIFLTGLEDEDSVVRGLEAGGVDFLSKPINTRELVARIKVHISNARRASNANSALDSVGHKLFTANTRGQVLWSTPGVKALLDEAGLTQHHQNSARELQPEPKHALSQQLSSWLSRGDRAPGHKLNIQHSDYPLIVECVEYKPGGDSLLKLIDGKQPGGAELLRQALPLTERESQVLLWIANGKTNREIATILDMSPRTVNKHLEPIFRKLEVDNRTSAAAKAIRLLDA